MKTAIIITLLCIGIAGTSCSQGGKKNTADNNLHSKTAAGGTSPAGYDLSSPVKYTMPADLLEISGIAFDNGDNSTLYAEQDEDGRIFYFRPGDDKVNQVKFGKAGDYEDVAILNNQAVLLRSDGSLFSFPLSEVKAGEVKSVKEFKKLLPKGEYEGLHADGDKLYALCKQCAGADHNKECNGYILNLAADGNITQSGIFTIDVQKIAALIGKMKLKFHPSALAKSPVTKQWYVLSSVNKLLVVLDSQWNALQAYPLSGKTFLQPEGMAFDKQGNLYISNEGDKITNGNVLLFKYKKGER
ncbi:SdiA-regulated domain-containing protein [Mucilaginibacter sp. 14171R-50]|uniref:SdiA-regulated domain-containing protein n=1 Tax=Mucilaginibacter sp. 14171R-50 TaxID=2703789 RepID=UPI001EE474BB|nr:SdiA-regulated domain-containing protein [Mucilaginibacter sp. 14171R-50]